MTVYLVPGVFGAGGQILDSNGKVASGALVNTYAAGTTSPVPAFTTAAGNVTAANPVTANADGRLPYELWQTGGTAIKIFVTDSLLNTLGNYDNLTGVNDFSSIVTTTQTWTAPQTFSNATIISLTATSIIASSISATTITATNVQASSLSVSTLKVSSISIFPAMVVGQLPLPTNLSLVPSVNGNAFTMTVKAMDGTDPSTSNPVYIPFRNVNSTAGDLTWLSVVAPMSLTVPAGAALGTSANTPFHLWFVAFNDGSVLRPGVMNTVSGTNVFPLAQFNIASAVTISTASIAQTFYTASTITAKAYSVLGYSSWESGLGTAGLYSANCNRTQPYMFGTPLPGQTLQTVPQTKTNVFTTTSTAATDIIGLSLPITPTSAANLVRFMSSFVFGNTTNGQSAFVQLVRNTTSIALGDAAGSRVQATTASLSAGRSNDEFDKGFILWMDQPGSASVVTYKLQGWVNAGTFYINSSATDTNSNAYARTPTYMEATEIMV